MRAAARTLLFLSGVLAFPDPGVVHAAGAVDLVGAGATMRYLANAQDPGIETTWVAPGFDDRAWTVGRFGVGREDSTTGGAHLLLETIVPVGVRSVYTRTTFHLDDASGVRNLYLGLDYDDGYVVWLNGVEVLRSESMRGGATRWDTTPASHESSNGASPSFWPLDDLSARGIPLLRDGDNVLAIGVWNHSASSSDLVLVPRLIANEPLDTFVVRGPYLQLVTDTSVIVRWSTDRPTDSRVAFGKRPDALDHAVSDPDPTTRHRVRIEGLEPDSEVYYSVGTTRAALAGGDTEHVFRTAPRPGSRPPVRAWVIGDSGTAGWRAGWVRNGFAKFSAERPASLWLMLGDNAYPFGTDEDYQRAVFQVYPTMLARTPLYSTMGNHDGVDSHAPPRGPYYEVFDFPTRGEAGGVPSGTEDYYAFDYANVHYICLNSELTGRRFGKMLKWLRRDLAGTDQDWTVAFWHHAPYGTGRHDSDRHDHMMMMRTRVLPILDAGGVDLALTGHMHAYARTALLHGHYGPADSLTPASILDGGDGRVDGDGAYHKPRGKQGHRGIVYVVVGCSGEAVEYQLDHPALLVGITAIGSLALDVAGDRLDATFVDPDGDVLDHFTILKDEPQVTSAPDAPQPGSPRGPSSRSPDGPEQAEVSREDGARASP